MSDSILLGVTNIMIALVVVNITVAILAIARHADKIIERLDVLIQAVELLK